MSITLTEAAAREIKDHIRRRAEADGSDSPDAGALYLRVGVKSSGCSGLSYSLELTDNKTDQDESATAHGVEVICDPKSMEYLRGTTVDFKDELAGRGFVFNNPNAAGGCGCGSSFAARAGSGGGC
jgi:iron-sulfur cluster assembly protein